MAGHSFSAYAIKTIDEMLSAINESRKEILLMKTALLDIRDEGNVRTAPGPVCEESTIIERDFDTMREYLKGALRFCCCFLKSLSQSIRVLPTPLLEGNPIRQDCDRTEKKWLEIRKSPGYPYALRYEFSFKIDKLVHRLIQHESVTRSDPAATEVLDVYEEFLSGVGSFPNPIPDLYLECAGSSLFRAFERLTSQLCDTRQHIFSKISYGQNQQVQKSLEGPKSAYFHGSKTEGGRECPISLLGDEDETELTEPSVNVEKADTSTRRKISSVPNQTGPSLLLNTGPGSIDDSRKRHRGGLGLENHYGGPERRRLRTKMSHTKLHNEQCSCVVEAGFKCTTVSECSFRAGRAECPSGCGSECRNQRISRGEFTDPENLEVKPAGKKGLGLFTNQDIAKGQLVIEYIGEPLLPGSQPTDQRDIPYLFQCETILINGNKGGNKSKNLNHSCQPNLESESWQVKDKPRIVFVAKQDIKRGAELTFSYNRQSDERCFCEAEQCSGTLKGWTSAGKRRLERGTKQ